jgi:hypothetical protein
MDSTRFDRLIRRWSSHTPRRTVVGALIAGVVGLATVAEFEVSAGKKSKKVTLCHQGQTLSVKKSKKGSLLSQGATLGACPASPPTAPPAPPPPPPATCLDGSKNGDETDVDCGGSCARCGLLKQCRQWDDCITGNCLERVCRACVDDAECFGTCRCSREGICVYPPGFIVIEGVESCAACPPRTASCSYSFLDGGRATCFPRCGETLS